MANSMIRRKSLTFKLTVPINPAVTVSANSEATLLNNVDLSAYGTFDHALLQFADYCVPINCQGDSNMIFLKVRNLASSAVTISSVVLLCFRN